jgi:hypothetical protein
MFCTGTSLLAEGFVLKYPADGMFCTRKGKEGRKIGKNKRGGKEGTKGRKEGRKE